MTTRTTDSADQSSLQERYFAGMMCFGCGPANLKGLRLRSFADDDGTVRAAFTPWPEHDNGLGYLNGGIIATILDCHGAAAVVLAAAGLGLAPDGTLQYVTAGLDVRYLRPSPLDQTSELVARTVSADESEIVVDIGLWWDQKVRARGTSSWKRWRPRSAG
jgi:acyl-coenzyme A thioesterase PaaI-like protein